MPAEWVLDNGDEMMDKLFIVIPAYNEAENIETVVDEWYQNLKLYGGGRLKACCCR